MPQKQYQLNIRIDQHDLENIDFLKKAGKQIPNLIRDFLARQVDHIETGLDGFVDEIKMESISVRKDCIVVYGPTLPGNREILMDMLDDKRLTFLPGRKGFVIKI